MQEKFEAFVREQKLFDKNDRVLVALSGGVDSVVLGTLMLRSGYTFSVAHCNFHLRGEESNRDERFVRSWAEKNKIKLFVSEFDTYEYMQQKGISLEMAARELRYSMFKNLMTSKGFSLLATAHHADDSAETFFINLLRGTGIAGLHGILPKHDNIVRPLLFATRKDIFDFAKANNIPFVEDSTNEETQFLRNKIRHRLFPLLKDLCPNFDTVIKKDIDRLRETEIVFRSVIERLRADIIEKESNICKINIDRLRKLHPIRILLYELLSEYGFNETDSNNVLTSLEKESGKQFFSKTHRLLKDRNYLFITPLNADQHQERYLLNESQNMVNEPIHLVLETLEDLTFVNISKDRNIAMFDKDMLRFPLVLRHWKQGDAFVPFGMNKSKKLSDFFISEKYSLIDKQQQWLLCSGDDIIWIVGRRMDNRFKISEKTKTILKIEIQ
mgnify:FL=1